MSNVQKLIEQFGGAGKFKVPKKGEPGPSLTQFLEAGKDTLKELRDSGTPTPNEFKAMLDSATKAIQSTVAYLELAVADEQSKQTNPKTADAFRIASRDLQTATTTSSQKTDKVLLAANAIAQAQWLYHFVFDDGRKK
jgi:hypothetical protein